MITFQFLFTCLCTFVKKHRHGHRIITSSYLWTHLNCDVYFCSLRRIITIIIIIKPVKMLHYLHSCGSTLQNQHRQGKLESVDLTIAKLQTQPLL